MTDQWNEDDPRSYPNTIHRLRNNTIAQAWLALMNTLPIDDLNPEAASMFSFAQGVRFALHAIRDGDVDEAALRRHINEFLKDCRP